MEAKTTCHSGCGCSCGHNKGEEHPNVVLPILSFILLIVGLILNHTGQGWFSPTVKLVWYLAAFLPVGLPVIREAYHEALRKDFFTEFTLMSVASTGAFSIGEYPEAVAVMLFYTVGEMLQNRAVERASQNISRLLDVRPERTDVFREGNYINVSPKEVRTGERIEVKPGGRIPLDGILQETEASFDTSALTGESMPRILRKGDEVLAGMIVLGQTVRIEVNRPYEQSALARILVLVKDAAERKAPAELFIRRFARFYTPAVIVLALLIVTVPAFAGLMMPSFQYVFHDWLYRGLVFLVISCPCALVISVPLGYFGGIGAASRAGILFKGGNYLDAITKINTVVFDKTGTLTQNKMTVEHYYVDGQSISADKIDLRDPSQSRLLISSILCNDSTNIDGVEIGDPTETALINLGSSLGLDPEEVRVKYPRESENPFDSDRKMMATKHSLNGVPTMIVKGAVDVLLNRTDWVEMKGETHEITEETRRVIEEQNQKYSREGLRVLAFAYKEVSDETELTLEDEDHLIFLGLIAMMDPPREESQVAVAECLNAGIRPIMITGDHKVTAAAIAKRIGILKDESEACEGADIENMSDEQLKKFVPNISVYARVSPEHKIRIVRAWQEKGMIVAMTGDGVNDAPALKQADIGVAMGITGSEVSKDAAAMVLTDDNFATIVKAVENGRNLYRNIKYAIQFLLSGNFGAILAVLCASLAGLPVPFAPVHLLFINLLTDSLPAIALGVEPHSSEVMNEKPRSADESILTKDFLGKIGLEGLVIGMMTMIGFLTGYHQNGALLGSTYAFGTLCLARLFHGFNCKSDHPVIFTKRFFNNKWLQGAFALGSVLITAVLTVPGLHFLFKVETLNLMQLGCVYLYAFASLPIIQMLKWIRMKLRKRGE